MKNDPVLYIQKSSRASAMRKVIFQVIKKIRFSVIRIQKHARGFLARHKMQKQLISYFDSIGEIELTMSPEEIKQYRAMNTLKKHLPGMIKRYKWKRLLRLMQIRFSKTYKGYKMRYHLNWALDKPLNLRENRTFFFMKEQKYLIKHILLQQTQIPQ